MKVYGTAVGQTRLNKTRMRVVMEFAYPTQIETLCKGAGLNIVAMKRIRIGRVSMKKLPPGEWRYLSRKTMF